MRKPVLFPRDLQPPLRGAFFPLLGHDTDRVRLVTQGDGLHFFRRSHLEIQRKCQRIHQRLYVAVRDMAAIFPQMRRYSIRAGRFGDPGRPYGVGIRAPAGIPHGCNVVDVDPKSQLCRHLFSPLLNVAATLGKPVITVH